MKSHRFVAAALLTLVCASPVWAHFVWVAVQADSGGKPAAHVWFSELAEPDSADLIDKIGKVKVWRRDSATVSQPLEVKKHVEAGGGAFVAGVPDSTANVAAKIQYGVITRGEQTFLLEYWAKYLDASQRNWQALARDPALKLDVVPHGEKSDFVLEILFDGKPAAGSELVILDPSAKETKVQADASGKYTLAEAKPGLYSIRAKWVVTGKGKLGDAEYAQVNHYSTLALRVPGSTK